MEEMRILIGKSEEKSSLKRPTHQLQDNIKIVKGGRVWIRNYPAQNRDW
jgi:hypothetical protein